MAALSGWIPSPPGPASRRWIRLLQLLVVLLLAPLLLIGLFWAQPAWGQDAASAPADGQQLFASHCVGCHLQGGNIIRRGKTLRMDALRRNGIAEPAAIARIAAAGVGQMGGYGDVLGPGGSERVADWVWQQAEAGWPRS